MTDINGKPELIFNKNEDYQTLIDHHKKHHEEEGAFRAHFQMFIDGQETEIAKLRAELHEARDRLLELANAECTYRQLHDLRGDGSLESGRAWDNMCHSGDKAIVWLFAHPIPRDEI